MTDIPLPQDADDGTFTYGIDSSGNLLKRKVGVQEIDYNGRFGATAYSGSQVTVGIGSHYFVLDIDDPNFRVGDDVLVTSLIDRVCFMWGEVIGSDTVSEPRRLFIYVDDISQATGTYSAWTIQVVARPKPGIEKDTSVTSVNPTTGGPWTFTVTAGKFFPTGGTLLIKPTTDRTIALIGEVESYSGTSLTVSLRATNATVSQSYSSWSIALLDSPPAVLPLLAIVGLTIEQDSGHSFNINPGSVMDSTGTVLLTLNSVLTKNVTADWAAGAGGGVSRVLLTGTVTGGAGATLTGSSTLFTTELAPATAVLTDFDNQGGEHQYTYQADVMIEAGSKLATVRAAASDTSCTLRLAGSLNGVTAQPYYRGARLDSGYIGQVGPYYAALIRKDSDGSIDVCFTTNTPSGEPDLPSGYTYYRILGRINITVQSTSDPTLSTIEIYQPLYNEAFPFAPKSALYVISGTDVSLPNYRSLSNSTGGSTTVYDNGSSLKTIEVRRAALTGDVTASADSNATTLAAGNAGNLNSGTLGAARMPALTGDVTSSVGTVATTLSSAPSTLGKQFLYFVGASF